MPTPSISLRAFGRAEDLDIALDVDLAQADRPALVTQLLERCGGKPSAAFWWSRPVGMRIGALLRLVALTEESDTLDVVLRCVQPDCGERFEAALPLAELAARAPAEGAARGEPLRIALPGGRQATLRLPTGDDLREWRTRPHASPADAVAAVIDTLRLDGDLQAADVQPGDAAALAEAIAAHDPLVAFSVVSTCPA